MLQEAPCGPAQCHAAAAAADAYDSADDDDETGSSERVRVGLRPEMILGLPDWPS